MRYKEAKIIIFYGVFNVLPWVEKNFLVNAF